MHPILRIFIHQLRDGHKEKIHLSAPSDFLALSETEVKAVGPVLIEGEAYLVDDELILCLTSKANIQMPCSICNKMIDLKLVAKEIYCAQPISELVDSIFDYSGLVREELLLLLPQFAECEKSCPERKTLTPLFKKPSQSLDQQYPFANL